MEFIKHCLVLCLILSDAIGFSIVEQLKKLPILNGMKQSGRNGKLQEAEVYNGVKKLLRTFITDSEEPDPDADPYSGQDQAQEQEESGSHKTPDRQSKGSKHTNVNFVLYNSGIKFRKTDDSSNKKTDTKMKFNCILVVVSEKKCYGWDSKNGTNVSKRADTEGSFANFLPDIMPLLARNGSLKFYEMLNSFSNKHEVNGGNWDDDKRNHGKEVYLDNGNGNNGDYSNGDNGNWHDEYRKDARRDILQDFLDDSHGISSPSITMYF